MEVTNSWLQSSHDHAWRMRPATLNADCSATSSTLPHRGQLGRPKSRVGTGSTQAQWMLIVASPRRSQPHPELPDTSRCCPRSVAALRRLHETLVAAWNRDNSMQNAVSKRRPRAREKPRAAEHRRKRSARATPMLTRAKVAQQDGEPAILGRN
jgi:hypothetical protein